MARILVVEDNADQLELRTLLLERAGHHVYPAGSVEEALQLLKPLPEAAVVDLSLPDPADGRALVRKLHALTPETRIAVLTGWSEALRGHPEEEFVAAVLDKPCPTARLLETIARLVACLLVALLPVSAKDFKFSTTGQGEPVAELELKSPGSDFGIADRAAAVAQLRVDDGPVHHVMVFGERKEKYSVFLGPLKPGDHVLNIERDPQFSAALSRLEIGNVKFREDSSEIASRAPVLFARADTIGKFSDVPLLLYAEESPLTYTVIFSNEDGGHSTAGLMARWGRITDIEYVYRVEARGAFIQTKDHKDVPYAGEMFGKHPLLIPITLNNMVAPGQSAMRFQMLPERADLGDHSREIIMDRHGWTYAIASKEITREGHLADIRDPRNYLYIEAKVKNQSSRVAFKARLTTESTWRTSHRDDLKLAIERDGWVRSTIELPRGTSGRQIAEFEFDCLPQTEGAKAECSVESVSAFFLTPDYEPGRPVKLPGNSSK